MKRWCSNCKKYVSYWFDPGGEPCDIEPGMAGYSPVNANRCNRCDGITWDERPSGEGEVQQSQQQQYLTSSHTPTVITPTYNTYNTYAPRQIYAPTFSISPTMPAVPKLRCNCCFGDFQYGHGFHNRDVNDGKKFCSRECLNEYYQQRQEVIQQNPWKR